MIAAVFFLPIGGSLAQPSGGVLSVRDNVQLLSSYNGRITKFITVTIADAPPFEFDSLCIKLGFDQCCSLGIASLDVSINNHWQRQGPIKAIFSDKYEAQFNVLQSLFDDYVNARNSFLEGSLLGDTAIVNVLVGNSVVKQWNEKQSFGFGPGRDVLHYLIQQELQQTEYSNLKDIGMLALSDTQSVLIDSVLVKKLALRYMEIFDSVVNIIHKPDSGCFNRFTNISNYCASASCKEKLYLLFSNFAQDKFYGLQSDENVFGLVDHTITIPKAPTWENYVSARCQCGIDEDWQGTTFGFDIPGGNILVADSFVLIGRDELEEKYMDRNRQDVLKRLNNLNIDTSLSDDALRDAVTHSLENKICKGKKIVWVGLDRKHQRYHASRSSSGDAEAFSPLYHIDVFISLLGTTKGSNGSLLYLLAEPMREFLNDSILSSDQEKRKAYLQVFEEQKKFICETAKKMEKDVLRLTGVKMKRVTVPLPFYLPPSFRSDTGKSYWMTKIFSPTNGFVENVNGDITYYLPNYTVNESGSTEIDYQRAYNKTKDILKHHSICIKEISYGYTERSGLHCIGQVLGRE